MSSYKDLEIFQLAFELAIKIHHASLKLPKFELFEQRSQIRRASKSVKDNMDMEDVNIKPNILNFLPIQLHLVMKQ
jgi:hypothetical protein